MLDIDAVVIGIQRNQCICQFANRETISATKKRFLGLIRIGDVVSLDAISNKKMGRTQLHKIVRVRHDLHRKDVLL